MKTNLDQLFEDFKQQSILVVGDVMMDAYLWGKVERISPEAPVPIVNVMKRENRLGGSANVALNLVELGAHPIICSVVGDDRVAEEMMVIMKEKGMQTDGIVQSPTRMTTVKTRVISSHQQMLRIDEEVSKPISTVEEDLLIDVFSKIINGKNISAVIFEDYNKGVLTEKVIQQLIQLCREKNIPTCVDPKKQNFFAYKKVSLFKPNLKELREGLKLDIDLTKSDELSAAVLKLEKELEHEISLITLSERGIYLKKGSEEKIIPAHKRNIADVSGAGDSVIAVASLCMALKTDINFMAALSNLAGGLVCEQTGVVPISAKQLKEEAKIKLTQL